MSLAFPPVAARARYRSSLPALLFVLLAAACGTPDPEAAGALRVVLDRMDDEGGRPLDTTLTIAGRLEALPNGELLIVDYGDAQVVHLDSSLHVRERFGRRGKGPGEFEGITSVSVHDGLVAVADISQRRITFLTSEGVFVRLLPLPEAPVGETRFDAAGRLHVNRRAPATPPATPPADSGVPVHSVYTGDGAPVYTYGDYLPHTEPPARSVLNQALFGPAPNGDMWTALTHRGRVVRYDSTGAVRSAFDTPIPAGVDSTSPFLVESKTRPGLFSLSRKQRIYAFTVVADSLPAVATQHLSEDGTTWSELLVYAPDGTLLARERIEGAVRDLSWRDGVLHALWLDPEQTPMVSRFRIGG